MKGVPLSKFDFLNGAGMKEVVRVEQKKE